MKSAVTLIALFFCLHCSGQKFTLDVGVGFGGVLEEQSTGGRGLLFAAPLYQLSDSYSIGLDLGTGGNLFPVDVNEMPGPTVELISPYSARFNHALLKGVYFGSWDIGYPFVAVGAGINSYRFFVHTESTDLVSQNNFVAMVELGIRIEEVITTSFRYYSPGKTPNFSGVDQNRVTKVIEETSFSMLVITMAYTFDLFNQ